jgi:hypothetical protein
LEQAERYRDKTWIISADQGGKKITYRQTAEWCNRIANFLKDHGIKATVGDPARFHNNQSAFSNWEGVVPGAKQSSDVQAKGLRMTKAGPSIMRMALYQAGDIGRRWDP